MLTIVISGIGIMGMYVLFICIFHKKQLLHEKKKEERLKEEKKWTMNWTKVADGEIACVKMR